MNELEAVKPTVVRYLTFNTGCSEFGLTLRINGTHENKARGNKQRGYLALAWALSKDLDVIILDKGTSNLALKLGKYCSIGHRDNRLGLLNCLYRPPVFDHTGRGIRIYPIDDREIIDLESLNQSLSSKMKMR